MSDVVIISLAILAFSLVSERLRGTVVTPPMAFAAFGLLIGPGVLSVVEFELTRGAIHLLAEVTLVLVLFADAARIDLRLLLKDHNLPLRMLVIGFPLTILFGLACALVLPLGLTWAEAGLLAAVLAPTDAALGQSVVSNKKVPVRIRQALNVESGLNDGIALPFVFLFAMLASDGQGSSSTADLAGFALSQITLGPLAGLAVGWAAAKLMDQAATRGWLTEIFEGPAVLSSAALAYGAAQLIGGNGFISAFVAGLIFGFVIQGRCKFLLEFAESEGQVLTLLAFLVFGVAMLPEIAGHLSWAVVLYAVLSLTVIRMAPIAVSLLGTGVSGLTVAFLGWFGPRGLASILFSLLVLEEMNTPAAGTILTVTILTVALSIALHGLTAAPLAKRYARIAKEKGECAENQVVSEMPTRHGMAG